MNQQRWFCLMSLWGFLLWNFPVFVVAQEDPFGADPFGDFGAVAAPAGTGVPDRTDEAGESPEEIETNPAVLAIRDSQPGTPLELAKAVDRLLKLQRPDEARKYLAQLAAADLSAPALESLQRELGSVLFMRLIGRADLQPEGAEIGNRVLDAALSAARSPARLAALIDQLGDPSADVRRAAVQELKQAEEHAALALIAALATPNPPTSAIRSALRSLGRRSIEPLIATLAAEPDEVPASIRESAMRVLGQLGAPEAIPFLLVPYFDESTSGEVRRAARETLQNQLSDLPSRREAERFLERRARARLAAGLSGQREPGEFETIYRWSADAGRVEAEAVSTEVAVRFRARRVAGQLYRLDPHNPAFGRLYYTALLEEAQRQAGWDKSLPLQRGPAAETAQLGTAQIESLLAAALQQGHHAAAVAAYDLLGALGDEGLLTGSGGQPTVMARGLTHSDRRIRHAAVMNILRLDPRTPFAGSSFVPENLAYLVRTAGTRRALIAHPRTDQAQTLVGMLAELGFEADTAARGWEAYRMARRNPDYEFVLASDLLDQPPVAELFQRLRRDPLTQLLPVGVLARENRFEVLQSLTEGDPLAETFPRPHSVDGLNVVARRLLVRGEDHRTGYEQRLDQARQALQQLARLAERSETYPFYDLLRHEAAVEQALFDSNLSVPAADVLGLFATPSAQRSLVTVASQHTRPLGHRRAAVEAFRRATERRGLLLTRDEILRQYDRYNGSVMLDRETQQVLGSLLDAIEAPSQGTVQRGQTAPFVES